MPVNIFKGVNKKSNVVGMQLYNFQNLFNAPAPISCPPTLLATLLYLLSSMLVI